jgi:hypothetical protein
MMFGEEINQPLILLRGMLKNSTSANGREEEGGARGIGDGDAKE